MEVPAEVPAAELSILLIEALQLAQLSGASRYILKADPPGRLLSDEESLAQAGAWDGALLVLQPQSVEHYLPAYFVAASGRKYQIPGAEVQIGRLVGDFHHRWIDLSQEPAGSAVSRHHARLVFKENQWQLIVSDQAKNRTLLNDKQLQPHRSYPLKHGDKTQFGPVKLEFCLEKID